ncbi:MAG TPA: hypothetical protein VMU84_08905, partial [Thermoanaerobaculia bacterium]|nr:hypothetical protein [Thermoanaerobaculia bacterium]
MELEEIRASLVSTWPRPTVLSSLENAAFEEQLRELTGANSARLWKSLCLLAGQIIEAMLLKRLQSHDPQLVRQRSKGLGQLIRLARLHQILPLPTPTERKAGEALLDSLRILRNWSAHYSLASKSTSELRATQALAISFCTTVALYPETFSAALQLRDEQMVEKMEQFIDLSVAEQLPDELRLQAASISQYAAVHSFRGIGRVLAALRRESLDIVPLQTAIKANFPLIIARIIGISPATLQNFIQDCLRLNLKEHARVVASFLPLDGAVLSEFIERSPASVAMYVQHSYRADSELFRAKFAHTPLTDGDVDTVWAALASRSAGVLNTAQIISHLPVGTRVHVMLRAPDDTLAEWIRESSPQDCAQVLRLFRDSDIARASGLVPMRDRLIAEVLKVVENSSVRELGSIPNFLRKARLGSESTALKLLNVILDVTARDESSDDADVAAARRILWDTSLFYPSF